MATLLMCSILAAEHCAPSAGVGTLSANRGDPGLTPPRARAWSPWMRRAARDQPMRANLATKWAISDGLAMFRSQRTSGLRRRV
eukprot:1208604-Pyramimonas_sp.AAC.1